MAEKYFIKTYGCQMNVHESEKLAGMLKDLGYIEAEKLEDAQVIVFNTCAIRDGVELKVFGNVGAVKPLKQKNPNIIVAVCGCMAQMKGRADIFKKKYPHVNIVFGTHNLNEFKHYLLQYKNYKKNIYEIWDTEKEIAENVEMYRTSNYNAWVNIMYGCNNFCTFCIVPYVRGRERSRDMNDIIAEVTDLVGQGFKYITLLGQNVNSYGNDIKDDPTINFANLLEKIAQIPGDFRVKFMSSHPKDLTEEVIKVIAKHDKISKYIHLPVQAGSNSELKRMNRNYTVEHYKELIATIRKYIPNVNLSTDIIVGFPEETEEEFLATYDLINEVRYNGVFAFMYSPRTGTVAERMKQIEKSVKQERIHKLLERSKEITRELTKEMVGMHDSVIVESVGFVNNKKCYVAKTDAGKTVLIFDVSKPVKLGEFYHVVVTKLYHQKLVADFVTA